LNGWIKKLWHDPVWSAVLATAIVALLATIPAYLFDWWPIIIRWMKGVFDFILSDSSIPNWLLVVLFIPLLLGLLVIGMITRNKYFPKKLSLNWVAYVEDTFFNIRWTWRYDETNKIVDLFSFCPSCGFQIYPQPHSDWMGGFIHTKFHCENCGQDFDSHPEQIPQLENKIIRHIQLKIRNNTWKDQNDHPHQN